MNYNFLADNMRELRRYRGLSQTDVARAAGKLTQTYISDLELGRKPRRPEHVAAIAAALKVTVNVLLSRKSQTRGAACLEEA